MVLRQIGVPRYLDRSDIVRSSDNYRLDIDANNWWGEPFGAMIARVLEQELSERLPGTSVFSDTGAIAAEADATVEINIQRMDADARPRAPRAHSGAGPRPGRRRRAARQPRSIQKGNPSPRPGGGLVEDQRSGGVQLGVGEQVVEAGDPGVRASRRRAGPRAGRGLEQQQLLCGSAARNGQS